MKKVGLLDDHTTAKLNQFVFKALLPVLLFMDLSKADFQTVSGCRLGSGFFCCQLHCGTIMKPACMRQPGIFW